MPDGKESSSGSYKLLPIFDKSLQEEKPKLPDERSGPHLLSGFQSGTVIFKFTVGAGWFSLPAAFQHSGVVVGIIWIFVCSGLTIYGMQRLVEASWEAAKRNETETAYFGDVGYACGRLYSERWGTIGRLIVDIIIAIAPFCLLCPMILFGANLWKQAFEEQHIVDLDLSVWILIIFVFTWPLAIIRRPDILAWFSLVANIFEGIAVIAVLVNIFSKTSSWKVNNSVNWPKLPLTVGMIFFAFEIAPFILSVENKSKNPKKLPLVINVVMIGISCLYGIVGTFGYLSCYPDCRDSILLNLTNLWFYSVLKVLIGLAACCSITLLYIIEYDIVEPYLKRLVPENRYHLMCFLFRTLVMLFTAGITASIPQLGNVMSLAGTIATSLVGFLLPAASHTLLLYNQISRWKIASNVVFFFCGLFILFAGTYTSILQIVEDY